jgi:hypothetical protein
MASTRNKNTRGNYNLELKMDNDSQHYNLYKHSQYGEAVSTRLPGNGLLAGQIYMDKLSHNPIQIESFLFGINSTNLVNPESPLVPQLKSLETVDIYKTPSILMPVPLVIEKNRPFPTP